MKRLLIIFTTIITAPLVHAQNVGIGTNTPQARLEVIGIVNSPTANAFMVRNTLNDISKSSNHQINYLCPPNFYYEVVERTDQIPPVDRARVAGTWHLG